MPISEFNEDKSVKDKYSKVCKECRSKSYYKNRYGSNANDNYELNLRKDALKLVGKRRICTICKMELAIEEFGRKKCTLSKHQSICKVCANKQGYKLRHGANANNRYELKLYKEKLRLVGKKKCTKCQLELPISSEFYTCTRTKDQRRSWCTKCEILYNYNRYCSDRYNHRLNWVKRTLSAHSLKKKKKFIVELSTEDLYRVASVTNYCVYCGIKLKMGKGRYCSSSATLDRINNTNTLTVNNTQIICRSCNTTKGTMPHITFLKYCASPLFSPDKTNSVELKYLYYLGEVQEKIRRSLAAHLCIKYIILLTVDQAYELYLNTPTCVYCGRELHSKGHNRFDNFSLDRKDNENILTIHNIQFICLRCNTSKSDRTHQEFMDYKQLISYRFDIEFEERYQASAN